MATAFDQWEKDPFFYAAEEVQESADRMESVYRQWLYGKTCTSKSSVSVSDPSAVDLRRDLHATLGTAKWQLEEFERAVRHSDAAQSTAEATVTRHKDFVEAISIRIGMVEKSLKESNLEEVGERALTWVRLDEVESDELALFLSSNGSEVETVQRTLSISGSEAVGRMEGETSVSWKNSSFHSNELSFSEAKDHHRIASSSTEFGVPGESPPISSDECGNLPLSSLPSLSELRAAKSFFKPKKWYRNGFKKWKALSQENVEETLPVRNPQLSPDVGVCFEKCKSCLSDCTDECCHKHHHEWLGALQRQLQRSQYQIQYGRPVQMMIWTIVTVLLIFLFVLRAS